MVDNNQHEKSVDLRRIKGKHRHHYSFLLYNLGSDTQADTQADTQVVPNYIVPYKVILVT